MRKQVFAIAAALLTSGCAGTSNVSDVLTAGDLARQKKGVAVLRAQILGHGCSGGTLTIGKKVADIYSAVRTIQTTASAAASGNDVMQVELPPDEYHVINVSCGLQSGRTMTTIALGQKDGTNLLGFGGDYKRSFASFRLQAGEIVNVGSLTVMSSGGGGSAHLTVTDLPAASRERFKKERPNLAAQITTRLMVVHRAPMSADERRQVCATYEELKAFVPALAAKMPAECTPQAKAPDAKQDAKP